MKLMTKELEKALSVAASGSKKVAGADRPVIVKYFDPCGRGTWYILEGEKIDGDWILYGYCVSPLGPDCDEYGYVSLNELSRVRNRLGMGIERDRGIGVGRLALKDVLKN